MNTRPALSLFALPILVLLLATACSKQDDAATPPPAPADATAAAPATTDAAPAQPPADATGDPTAQTTPPADSTPVAAANPVGTAANVPGLVAGTDYVVIPGGQPFAPLDGKIEVVEVFGYTCPHCASFQQLVDAWKPKLAGDVRFTYVPAPFGGYWIPYAKAFYTAQALGVQEASHDAVYNAVHLERSLPVQPLPSAETLAAFYAKFGADPKVFASTFDSFAINAKLGRARAFIERSFAGDVAATPALVINGKYRVTGKTLEDHIRIANQLIASERAAEQAAAEPVAQ